MKKKIAFLKFFLAFFLFSNLVVFSALGETTGKGSARIFNNNEQEARNQALNNALRDAVKKGVGVLLDSNTLVKNWSVIRDEVISSSRGFVEKYDVTRDEAKNGTWFIEISAIVSEAGLKDKLTELRILHQKMGNKKLMVMYHARHPKALKDTHIAVDAARISIQDAFNSAGFRIFDQNVLGKLYSKIKPSDRVSGMAEDWVRVANENQVDIIVEYELYPSYHQPFSDAAFIAAKINISTKVYDVSTGRLISSRQTMQKQMTNAKMGSYDWDDALQKAGIKAGTVIADESIEKVVEYYKSVGDIGNSFFIVFKDFSENDADKILKVLEGLEGHQSLSERTYQPLLLEVEYFSTLNKGRLRRLLRAGCKREGVRLRSQEISGNRFIFANASTGN